MKKKIEVLNNVDKINYLTPPSHIVLVSSVSDEEVLNVAPFGMFMIASSKPPMVVLGISPKSDTYRNIVITKEFVVGIPEIRYLDRVYKAGDKVSPMVNEFEYAGLTPYKSKKVRAYRIEECCVNLECTLDWTHESGNHMIICGNVVGADINEEIFVNARTNVELRTSIDCAYHITGSNFAIGHKNIEDVK
jgi:flavin reductase (DIM6/NTAB) family NADH-FMN oxidoreductase RutF